jgi:hypothetical protein
MSPEAKSSKTRWQIERRREFIEHRLFWRGRIGLADMMDTFALSRTQASLDLNAYIKDHPDHLDYDKTAKTYVPGSKFQAHYTSLDPDKHLSKLLSMSQGADVAHSRWEEFQPDMLAPPLPARGASAEITRDVLLAIEQRRILTITYQSMSSPDPTERSIAPHALAHDGFRWHARALCLKDYVFKDFVLGRMLMAKLGDKIDFDPADDKAWKTEITLTIAPHPDLSDGQRRIVELDYSMENGTAELMSRKSMLYYTLKRLGLDTDPAARRAQEQHIVLVNASEVFAAMGRSVPW